jgi:type II secretory pathway pseudopilin PulG
MDMMGNAGQRQPRPEARKRGGALIGHTRGQWRETVGYRLLELGLVAAVVVFLITVVRPYAYGDTDEAREAQIKANLHNIQVEVERYGVDHAYSYPPYLIGGEPRAAAKVDSAGSDVSAFTKTADCPALGDVADPLLAEGYLSRYPPNPFTRNAVALHTVQANLPSAEFDGCDPLRNATAEGAQYGTRFGAECNLMGAVLADPRFRRLDDGTRTYADIEYEFWDMWIGDPPLPYLPGEFFYKSMGPLLAWDPQAPNPVLPSEIDEYIMGAYGGIRTKGKDILGDELPVPASLRAAAEGVSESEIKGDIWYMTRSEVSDDSTRRGGSAYGFGPNAQGVEVQAYGNPNGIRDALILILTAGG